MHIDVPRTVAQGRPQIFAIGRKNRPQDFGGKACGRGDFGQDHGPADRIVCKAPAYNGHALRDIPAPGCHAGIRGPVPDTRTFSVKKTLLSAQSLKPILDNRSASGPA